MFRKASILSIIILPLAISAFTSAVEARNASAAPPSANEGTSEGGFVAGIVEQLNGIKNFFCAPSPPPPISVAPPIVRTPKIKPPPPSPLKTEGELRRYLECYAPTDDVYAKIDKKYLPIIDSAARSFALPRSMIACLIFAESKFNPNAESPTGAFGLGQHTSASGEHITRILQPRDPKAVAKDIEIASRTPEENAKIRGTTLAVAREDVRVAKIREMNRSFATKWEAYYADLKQNKLYRAPTPRVVNDRALLDPTIAIGASALYLHMMMAHIKSSLDSDIVITNRADWNEDILLTAAGLYNMGPGAGSYVLRRIDPPDRKAWVEALMKSNEETAKYLITIRNCITSAAANKPAYQPPMQTHPYSCDPEDKPRVALGDPLKLPKEYQNMIKHARDVMPKKPKKPSSDADEKIQIAQPKTKAKSG